MALSSRIRLVLPFKEAGFSKVSSIKDRRCFSALPILFLLFCKGAYGNIRDRPAVLRGQSRALTVWSAGSFAQRKNKYL